MNQFRRFVLERLGRGAWARLTEEAGVPLADEPLALAALYPDEYLTALVPAASAAAEMPVAQLLEEFGVFVAPALLRVYEPLIHPSWGALDVIEHTEQVIHTLVRRQNPGAAPPFLSARRVAEDEVVLDYTSARGLCAVARGIGRGMGEVYGQRIAVSETECMHRGDPRCRLSFQLQR